MNVFEGNTFRHDKLAGFIDYYVGQLRFRVKRPFRPVREAMRIVMHPDTEYTIIGQLGQFCALEVEKEGAHRFYGVKIINDNTMQFGEVQICFNIEEIF